MTSTTNNTALVTGANSRLGIEATGPLLIQAEEPEPVPGIDEG